MKTLHAKSLCCQENSIRFGSRRRQCSRCRTTWRIRKKKRGRKPIRVHPTLLLRYFRKAMGTITEGVHIAGGRETRRRRMQRSLTAYLSSHPWEYPPGDTPLIAVADALWLETSHGWCTVYLIFLRPFDSTRAWILPPVAVPGKESARGWEVAWEEVPSFLAKRIRALVCDGKRALRIIARTRGWQVQLCHFHLYASLKNYATGHTNTKWEVQGKLLLNTVHAVITDADGERARYHLEILKVMEAGLTHRFLKAKLREFFRNAEYYRTYRSYPELNLPTTTNTAESFIRMVRELLGRSRGFRGAASLTRWLRAFCRYKQTMTCNGKLPTKLTG